MLKVELKWTEDFERRLLEEKPKPITSLTLRDYKNIWIKGFHTQLLKLETFNTTVKFILIIENPNIDTQVKQRVESALRSLIANVCEGIYVEYLIQKSVAVGKVAGPLTWILAEPVDGSAQSMYVGLDISTKRGISGAPFILLDPYGKLIDAKVVQLKSEVLRYQDYYDVLRYMVFKAREQGLKRIVILRTVLRELV